MIMIMTVTYSCILRILYLLVLGATLVSAYWQPQAGTRWQIVLSQALTPPYPPNISALDGDLFANPASTWSAARAQGIKTICYFSAGSFEDWRPDASQFNRSADLGSPLDGWPGEWWLNTRSANVRHIMQQRLDLAVQKGCDAVDPDNVDAYDNDGGGLGLDEDDAVDYIHFLAQEAHNRSLAIGLKNAGAIVDRVLDVVDFQVNEQCHQYGECDLFTPFITANKPVFGIEYTAHEDSVPSSQDITAACDDSSMAQFSTIIKHMSLNSWLLTCNVSQASTNTTASPAPTTSTESHGNRVQGLGWLSALGIIGLYIAVGHL